MDRGPARDTDSAKAPQGHLRAQTTTTMSPTLAISATREANMRITTAMATGPALAMAGAKGPPVDSSYPNPLFMYQLINILK